MLRWRLAALSEEIRQARILDSPDDSHTSHIIAANLRAWRQRRERTLDEIGLVAGVSGQQMQKYELGQDRIPASRLVAIARFLELPFETFLEGIDGIELDGDPREIARIQRAAAQLNRIPEPFRRVLVDIIQGFARAAPEILVAQSERGL